MSVNKDNRTEDEIKKDIALLGQGEEIERKLRFYEGTMLAIQDIYDKIEERIKRGYTLEERTFLGIFKVKVKKFLDSYDIGKLRLEMHDLEAEVFIKKGFFKIWKKRKAEYDQRFEEIARECNEKFEETLAKAKEVARTGQIRLQHTIERYEKEEADNGTHSQKEKNDFYMYMRKEITNHLNHKSKKSGR